MILISPLILISEESDLLTRLMLMAVWAVLDARWVFTPAESDWRNTDFTAETLVLLLAACKVFSLSDAMTSVWLAPLLTTHALATCIYLLYPAEHTVIPPPPRSLAIVLILCTLLAAYSTLLILLDEDASVVSTRSILLLMQAALAISLLASRSHARWLRSWLLLQLCELPYYYSRSATLFAVCIFILLAVVLVVASQEARRTYLLPVPGIEQIEAFVGYGLHLASQLLLAPVLYLCAATLCASVVIASSTQAWYTSTATFPPELQGICEDITDVLQTYVKPIWQFTGDPVIQQILVPALSEVSLARLSIYRAIYPLLPIFVTGRDGLSQTYVSADELAALLTLLFGPVITLVAVAASLFPRGSALVRSPVFWLFATFTNAVFLVLTQVATGLSVQVVRVIFVESEYTRTYTDAGRVAIVATGGLVGSCLAMVLVASVK